MTSIELKNLKQYAFTDPASGKSTLRRQRARQAIIVIAVDHLQRIFTLHTWAGNVPTSQYLDKLIKTCENYQVEIFGIEANAMQSLFADIVYEKAQEKLSHHRNRFVPIHQSTKVDKDFRIRTTLEPVINNGRLFIQQHQTELEAELRGFPTARTKDLVDCLASTIALVPSKPAPKQQSDEVEALASYLRRSGCPSHYIEQRIQEITQQTSGTQGTEIAH
jgi:hypothetical protein